MDNATLEAVKFAASAFEFLTLLVLVPLALRRHPERDAPGSMLRLLFLACFLKSGMDAVSVGLRLPLALMAATGGALEMAVVTLWYVFFASYLWNNWGSTVKAIRLSLLWNGVWLALLAAAVMAGDLPGQSVSPGGGALYYAMCWAPVFPLLLAEAQLAGRRRSMHPRDAAVLGLFPLPVFLGLALAYLIPGLPWKCPGLAFSVMALHLYLQSRAEQKDPLTGAYTRSWFKIKLDEHARDARTAPFALLMLDLDNFKKINDMWGHMEGDNALVKSVELLRKSLRSTDIIARFAGDEFLVLANLKNPDDCEIILRRIRENLLQYNMTSGKPYTLSWSTGTLYCDKPRNPDEMLAAVDEQMYRAKRMGKR